MQVGLFIILYYIHLRIALSAMDMEGLWSADVAAWEFLEDKKKTG
jgi:hypothetical protein